VQGLRIRCVSEPVHDEVKTFATTTSALLELNEFLSAQGVTHVAMEATGVYWKPVWHLLEGDFELILANAQHIKNVPGRKTDVSDAGWIADLMAHGLIRSSFVPPAPIQELRDLTRTRKQLVREVAQHSSRIQMLTAAYHMLKNGLEYQDLGASHFTRRDREKIILRLVRRINDLGCQVQLVPQAA
jgi:transposase